MRPRRYVYRHIFPITDPDRPISALRVEAAAVLDALAALSGARLVGEPVWVVAGDRLVVDAPARPAGEGEVGALVQQAVERLWRRGYTAAEIGDLLGVQVEEVPAGEAVVSVEARGREAA